MDSVNTREEDERLTLMCKTKKRTPNRKRD